MPRMIDFREVISAVSPGRRATVLPGDGTRRRRRGTVIVEFAIIATVVVFLVLGMIETSRAIMVKEALSNAARIGCRIAISPKMTNSEVTADINTILTQHGFTASDATITIQVNGNVADVSTAARGDKVTVTVSLPVSKVYWVSAVFLSKTAITVESISMMKQV